MWRAMTDYLQHVSEYEILISFDPSKLEQKVIAAIHDGWQPYGSLTVAHKPRDPGAPAPVFSQPMVKYTQRYR